MRRIALLLVPALAACSPETERGSAPPTETVVPQTIGFPDIEAHNLFGAGCAYASGTSMAPVVLALEDEAVMKIDGEIHRFVIDQESVGAEPAAERRYLARGRTLHLSIEGEGTQAGPETVNYPGSVRLLDDAGAVLYETTGTAQCGS